MERCTTTKKHKTLLIIWQNLRFFLFLRPEIDLIANYGQISKKTVSLYDVMHFIDKKNIVTHVDFDCGITS